MSKLNARKKGAGGELEAAKWLAKEFRLANIPERNLEQVRSGGHDLTGFQPLCIEVKRCEVISKRHWWLQATAAVTDEYSIPVVMYRQNHKKWLFLISAGYIGVSKGFIELEAREFKLWVETTVFS